MNSKRKPPTQQVSEPEGRHSPYKYDPSQIGKIVIAIHFTPEELAAIHPELSGSRNPHVKSAYLKVDTTIQKYEYRQKHGIKVHGR